MISCSDPVGSLEYLGSPVFRSGEFSGEPFPKS